MKLFLVIDNMLIYIENLKKLQEKLINEFSKVIYKMNYIYIHISREKLEIDLLAF